MWLNTLVFWSFWSTSQRLCSYTLCFLSRASFGARVLPPNPLGLGTLRECPWKCTFKTQAFSPSAPRVLRRCVCGLLCDRRLTAGTGSTLGFSLLVKVPRWRAGWVLPAPVPLCGWRFVFNNQERFWKIGGGGGVFPVSWWEQTLLVVELMYLPIISSPRK